MKLLMIFLALTILSACSSAKLTKEQQEEIRQERILKKLQSQGLDR